MGNSNSGSSSSSSSPTTTESAEGAATAGETQQQQEESITKKKEKETADTNFPTTTKNGSAGLAELGFDCRRITTTTTTTTNSAKEEEDEEDANILSWGDYETRLFHIETDTLITEDNQQDFIPNGPFFEAVALRVQQYIQQEILTTTNFGGLKLITLVDEEHGEGDNNENEPGTTKVEEDEQSYCSSNKIQALVSSWNESTDNGDDNNRQTKPKPTLLIITGKGISRCGIVSAKQCITEGFEKGSVLWFWLQAKSKGFDIIILDPNAQGSLKGMETIQLSLNKLFPPSQSTSLQSTTQSTSQSTTPPPLYVLAHSAAGGYLVRYLIQEDGIHLQQHLRAIVFTDSTHRLAWAQKKQPQLADFLESPHCLYIRNNSLGNPFGAKMDKRCGQPAETDIWWTQRFGKLTTIWAGTSNHSSMCWVSRNIIWNFLLTQNQQQQQLDASEEAEAGASAEINK